MKKLITIFIAALFITTSTSDATTKRNTGCYYLDNKSFTDLTSRKYSEAQKLFKGLLISKDFNNYAVLAKDLNFADACNIKSDILSASKKPNALHAKVYKKDANYTLLIHICSNEAAANRIAVASNRIAIKYGISFDVIKYSKF